MPSDAIASALTRLQGLVERVAKEEDGRRDPQVLQRCRAALDTEYWNVCRDLLLGLATDPLPAELVPPEEAARCLDFGRVGGPHQGFLEPVIAEFDGAADHGRYAVARVHQELARNYRELFGEERLRRLRETAERLEEEIKDHPNRMAELYDELPRLLKQVVPEIVDRQRILERLSTWEQTLEPLRALERKVKGKGLTGRMERGSYADLKQRGRSAYVEALQQVRGKDPEHRFEGLCEEIVELVDNNLDQRDDLDRLRVTIVQEEQEQSTITPMQARVALDEELSYLRQLMRMSARFAKMSPESVPARARELPTPARLFQSLQQIEEFDPRLFENRLVKRQGLPRLMVVPGAGLGRYDWKNNRLVIPMLYPRTLLESVASAVVNYRDDIDRQLNGREMIRTFQKDVKEHNDLQGLRLKNKLFEEYVNWMVKESNGYSVMERGVREWFEEHIAPNKHDVKYPRELREIPATQVGKAIEELAAQPEGPARCFHLGLLYWRRNAEDPDNQEKALASLNRAIQLDPELADAYYSLGVMYKRRKNRTALEMFRRFTQLSPQSWWSKKAQEHVAHF